MREVTGNLWTFHEKGEWVVIPTNEAVNKNGANPMGAGLALQAARRFPRLPRELGWRLKDCTNHVHVFTAYHIVIFPTKHHWQDKTADMELIKESAVELSWIKLGTVYLPQLGCGYGNLKWEDVRRVLEPVLDDRYIAVIPENGKE